MKNSAMRQASGTYPRGKDAPPSPARRWLGRALLATAMMIAANAAWLPAKAALAQQMLQSSWQSAQADGRAHRPWPGADTHAVARLLQPRLGVDQIVLAGDSGRPLAFGPGWAESSAAPGSGTGTTIISGHRDTHFAWLRDLRPGDALTLETPQGPRDFQVSAMQVVDSRAHRIATHRDGASLVLVTCWPFDATAPRGPMRYVVTLARLEAKALATDERG